jgi:hypothetical protein
VILYLCQPLAGLCQKPAFPGLLQVIDAGADGGDSVTELMAAGGPALRLVSTGLACPAPEGCVTGVGCPGWLLGLA